MSTNLNPSLCTLPVELIYHIFGYLDAQTIARSVRCVCKRLYTLVNTYDQFNFEFNSILKSDFLFLCNYIQAKNVISLTLSDDDETPGQIPYFLSFIRLSQFNQLHCLTLIEIDDCHLSIILKNIKTCLLTSLTIHSERDYSQGNTNADDFGRVISLLSLRKLNLNIPSFNTSQIVWPIECTIQHLEINCRTIDEYCHILLRLPNLRVFVVQQFDQQIGNGMIPELNDFKPICQLVSLTFKSCNIDMIILKLLLSLTPSIEYLQLMRSVDLNGFISHLPQWEKFVQTKLPLLNKFKFFLLDNNPQSVDIESLITPFLSSFWIEMKKWFVICDYITGSGTVLLYTPTFFDPQFEYVYQSKQIARSTSSLAINNKILMNGVKKMRLNLVNVMPSATSTRGGLSSNIIFPKVDELTLHIGNQWPLGSLRFLSTLIDLSSVVKLSLEIDNYYSEFTTSIDKLFKLAYNIRSVKISISSNFGYISDHNMQICSLLHKNVRHLTLRVSTVDQMQMVVHQLKHRSSIKFKYTNVYDVSEMHLAWLKCENGYYTYRLNNSSICMWFDNYVNRSEEN